MVSADHQELLDLIHGCWTTQALCAAVELGAIEALAARSLDAEGLSKLLETNIDATARLLNALVSLDVCDRTPAGRFRLTEKGRLLAKDHPGSLGVWALLVGRELWTPWRGLADSVRTGLSQFATQRVDRFDVLDNDQSKSATFHAAMAGLTKTVAASVADVASEWLAPRGRIVDVGSGHAELLAMLLARNPECSGIAYDRSHARDGADHTLHQAGLDERAIFVTGSFFDSVPPGEVLLLKSVLHDWNDDRCENLLKNCAVAMHPNGVMLVVERVLPSKVERGPAGHRLYRSDLNMLVGPGGRERTEAEFASLFGKAGLVISTVQSVAAGFSLLVI